MLALSLRNIVKEYSGKRPFRAVDDLSFDVESGETVAFLGPNGAGKSTTIKILCGILAPSSGQSQVHGFESGSKEAARVLGLVFGTRSQLWMHMTVRQSLEMLADIYGVEPSLKRKRLTELADIFEIGVFLEKRARQLSLGERMRCELVGALIHKPKVLLADEPTIGLDVVAKNELRQLVLRWQKEDKTTLLLTSHDVSDVEALCGRCILIDHGKKRFDGELAHLKGELRFVRRIRVALENKDLVPLAATRGVHLRTQEPFVHDYEVDTRTLPVAQAVSGLFTHYQSAVADVRIEDVPLEEVLSSLFRKETRP